MIFIVTFSFPAEPERLKLWERLWLERAPRHEGMGLAWFAQEFRFSVANIRNTILAARILRLREACPGEAVAEVTIWSPLFTSGVILFAASLSASFIKWP